MTNELTPIEKISLFESSKDERQSFAINLVEQIESGSIDPLKVHLHIKCMEDIIKQLNDNTIYKKSLVDAAEKYGQKSFQFMNSKIEIKEVGTKYDFSQCADPVYQQFEQMADSAKDSLKKRGDFLKTVPIEGLELKIDDEVVTVYPPSKSSTTSIAVTLK